MKRNRLNIFLDTIGKAKAMIHYSYRMTIHSNRAQNLSKIDLRKYRGNPGKKSQIRKLILLEVRKAGSLSVQLTIIASQPIRKHDFESGGVIIAEKTKRL